MKILNSTEGPEPAFLLIWIREIAEHWVNDSEATRSDFDPAALRLGGVDLAPLIDRHTERGGQRDAAAAYLRIRFLPPGEARSSTIQALFQIAHAQPAPAYANEMLGDVLLLSGRHEEALQAYLKDIKAPEAAHARKYALKLAVNQKSQEALQILCADELLLSEAEPVDLWKAAKQTGDRALLFRALWDMQWTRWLQGAAVPVALLAAAIWYIILVHTGSREKWRWYRHLPAVFAGVASVWLIHWWQGTLNYRSDPETAPTMTHELLMWIMHVGLPEELAKLLLFAFFLPVLLHRGSGVKAALTGGCVGLGFALDENLHYFRDFGSQIAIGRLLTANFIHISLTGILGWHLYELFRTRFHHATEFLTAFCAVVAAHGIYNFSAGMSATDWGGDIISAVVLALGARFYLAMLHDERALPAGGQPISRTAVFCLGTSLLCGLLMNVLVWDLGSLDGIIIVLQEMVAMALLALIYIREWREI